MLAIDISSEFLHLLLLKIQRQRWEVVGLAQEALPKGTVNLQRIGDAGQFSLILQRALKQLQLPRVWGKQKIIMALPVNQTMTKTVPVLDDLPRKALIEHLQQTVDNQMAATPAEVFWDYTLVTPPNKPGETEAILTIAQQAAIQAYQQLFAANQLALHVVDSESYALARAAQACGLANAQQDKPYGLLLLRKELLTLIIISATQPIYARTAPLDETVNYSEILVKAVTQLIKSVNFSPECLPLNELFLVGDYADHYHVNLIKKKLAMPVNLVLPPDQLQNRIHAEDFTRYFLSLGLALWSL